jgi:peptidoglycan/xylan/chitin deacetylase (PgdA/CDA1 family)
MSDYLKNLAFSMMNKTGGFLLSPPIGGGLGQYRNHGPRNQRRVALTFDDGPSKPCTVELLDAMAELNVKGTFFCVGLNATMNPDVIARAFAEGHTIANHSIAHRRMTSLKFTGADHIEQGAQEISKIIGCMPRLYRPPWGWLTPWEGRRLHQRGYTIVGWDVYTLDWRIPELDGHKIADDACSIVKPGSIFCFHDAYPGAQHWEKRETKRAVQKIVPMLRTQGYEFVTVPELFNIPAYAPLSVAQTQPT